MLAGYNAVFQTLLGTLFTWGMTAAGAALVFVFHSSQVIFMTSHLCKFTFQTGDTSARTCWSLSSLHTNIYWGSFFTNTSKRYDCWMNKKETDLSTEYVYAYFLTPVYKSQLWFLHVWASDSDAFRSNVIYYWNSSYSSDLVYHSKTCTLYFISYICINALNRRS